MGWAYVISLVLTIIGAINWGFWGLFEVDLVAALFDGRTGPISRVIYTLVGVAGIVLAVLVWGYYGVQGRLASTHRAR